MTVAAVSYPANMLTWAPHGLCLGYMGTKWVWAQCGQLNWGPLGQTHVGSLCGSQMGSEVGFVPVDQDKTRGPETLKGRHQPWMPNGPLCVREGSACWPAFVWIRREGCETKRRYVTT